MRLAQIVQDWIHNMEWDDQIKENEEDQTSSVNFGYGINDQSFKIWVETDEKRDWVKCISMLPSRFYPKRTSK
jgi:hypothetical protein